jgi:hypothetical protein
MHKLRNIFRLSNIRRYARVFLWLLKHVGLLLSASLEVYLHRNLGRRYIRKVSMSFLLCLAYASAAPPKAVLLQGFVTGFLVMLIFHLGFNSARRWGRHPEPHTYWRGEPWRMWQQFGFTDSAVRRFCEPAICLGISYFTSLIDPFFAGWLGAAAISLFAKEQIEYFALRRRVWDMTDSRIESQELTAAVDQYTNPRGGRQEGFNRAHLPNRPLPHEH